MHPFPAACLWLLCLLPAALGQEAFSDPDFDFRMQLPVGMRSVGEEDRARVLKQAPEQTRNLPRGEAGGAPISHSYLWIDETTPYNRQIGLGLADGLPPYRNPTELKTAQARDGFTIEVEKLLAAPPNTVYLEGTFLREVDQMPMRKILLYMPDFVAQNYGVLTLQAFAADWEIVKPEFEATVASVRMKRTKSAPSPGAANA
ncbi:MAG TPA: hypothetical protein VFD43_06580, partial [Planctomycetota bacterium]|nr:hypothetical protein [Planctomycetota bacterium]